MYTDDGSSFPQGLYIHWSKWIGYGKTFDTYIYPGSLRKMSNYVYQTMMLHLRQILDKCSKPTMSMLWEVWRKLQLQMHEEMHD